MDVGAGSGYFIFELMSKCVDKDALFVGIDPSVDQVKWLENRRREEKSKNILTVVGDGRALPFREHAFNIIVCSEVLEHIPAKREAIDEMAYCLKTGGLLLLSTPSKKAVDLWNRILMPLAWIMKIILRRKVDSAPYDRPIDRKELIKYLTDTGFAFEKSELNVILPPTHLFTHLPSFFTRVTLVICGFLERFMKQLLAPYFAWHIVMCARKISTNDCE